MSTRAMAHYYAGLGGGGRMPTTPDDRPGIIDLITGNATVGGGPTTDAQGNIQPGLYTGKGGYAKRKAAEMNANANAAALSAKYAKEVQEMQNKHDKEMQEMKDKQEKEIEGVKSYYAKEAEKLKQEGEKSKDVRSSQERFGKDEKLPVYDTQGNPIPLDLGGLADLRLGTAKQTEQNKAAALADKGVQSATVRGEIAKNLAPEVTNAANLGAVSAAGPGQIRAVPTVPGVTDRQMTLTGTTTKQGFGETGGMEIADPNNPGKTIKIGGKPFEYRVDTPPGMSMPVDPNIRDRMPTNAPPTVPTVPPTTMPDYIGGYPDERDPGNIVAPPPANVQSKTGQMPPPVPTVPPGQSSTIPNRIRPQSYNTTFGNTPENTLTQLAPTMQDILRELFLKNQQRAYDPNRPNNIMNKYMWPSLNTGLSFMSGNY